MSSTYRWPVFSSRCTCWPASSVPNRATRCTWLPSPRSAATRPWPPSTKASATAASSPNCGPRRRHAQSRRPHRRPPPREPPQAGLRALRTGARMNPRPSSHSWKSHLTSDTDAHLSLEATPSVRRISRCKDFAWRLIGYSTGCRRPDAVERASSALLLRILWAGSVKHRSCQDTSLGLCFNAMKV